jgi:PhzF family phenazine biosynthesis protein
VYQRYAVHPSITNFARTDMKLYQVDSFTKVPFAGNPAAVCIMRRFPEAHWMQQMAAEMNLSETAFVVPDGPPGHYMLRWFTPALEVDLCGHATLAAAHVIYSMDLFSDSVPITFETLSGELSVEKRADGKLQMDFPAEVSRPDEPPEGLLEALGAQAVHVGRNRMDLLVEVADEAALKALRPNFPALEAVPVRGVIVTAASDGQEKGGDDAASRGRSDFVSRFFAPRAGVPEDPVTGSAHCCLGPYWAGKLGKSKLRGYQVSRRGGFVEVEVRDNRVLLAGDAVTVFSAELHGTA